MAFNAETKMFEANDHIWEGLFEVKPNLRHFRFNSVPFVEEMQITFDGRIANGNWARSALTERPKVEGDSNIDPALHGRTINKNVIKQSPPFLGYDL
jgi:hypothetical protein